MSAHLKIKFLIGCGAFIFLGCHAENPSPSHEAKNKDNVIAASTAAQSTATASLSPVYTVEKIAQLHEPWALVELPDQRLLISEKSGKLKLFNPATRSIQTIQGIPEVAYGGQGGLGDVILHPDFAKNQWIYLSYAERGRGGYGAVVVRAILDLKQNRVTDIKRIWTQVPKFSEQGHYAHRLLFGPEGKLWISSGERQQFHPAQDLNSNAGKIIRLNADGSVPPDNPFIKQGKIAGQIWSLGHRNPLGMAFDSQGQLWVIEMGPKGGDELNKIIKGKNYGYPIVSNGDHYDGRPIPDHQTRPEFAAPLLTWTPVISPSDLIFYQGKMFPQWQGKALATGLSSKAIVIIDTQASPVKEVERLERTARMRGMTEAQDGSLWVIEDGSDVAALLKLTAVQ